MRTFFSKKVIAVIVIIVVIFAGVFYFTERQKNIASEKAAQALLQLQNKSPKKNVIGKSVLGRDIESYKYGNGATNITFIGGIHGGYEWNSVLLAYKFMDYLSANPEFIPKGLSITVIPSANPDGVFAVVNKEGRFTVQDIEISTSTAVGRFNADNVDLNRNFDCKWKSEAVWQNKKVSAGTKVFSEPEAQAIKKFVLENNPSAVVFWHSQSNTVYGSECKNGMLPETLKLMNLYSKASGYQVAKTFDNYVVTGDASDWLASIKIPAITVELKTHENIEWEQNLKGINAVVDYFSKE
jgi:hypothetical protein